VATCLMPGNSNGVTAPHVHEPAKHEF